MVPGNDCARTFQVAGHFENLVEGDPGEHANVETPSLWRYGPFIQSVPVNILSSPKDRVMLRSEGIAFDWTITFSQQRPGLRHLAINSDPVVYDARQVKIIGDHRNSTAAELASMHEFASTFSGFQRADAVG